MGNCIGRLYKSSPSSSVDESSSCELMGSVSRDDAPETSREEHPCRKIVVAGGDGESYTPHEISSTSWDDLPDDCWEAIFYRLDDRLKPVTVVCKRFLSMSNACRATLNITPAVKNPSLLYTRFPNLHSIHVCCTRPDVDNFVRQLAVSSLPLTSLSFSCQTHFPADAMGLLGRRMRSSLGSLALGFRLITDEDLLVIADHFSYISSLDFNGSGFGEKISDEAFRVISTKLVSLVSISFTTNLCHTTSSLSMECLSANWALLSDLIGTVLGRNGIGLHRFSSFQSLSSLEIKGVHISDGGILHLSRAGLKLEKLILHSFYEQEDFQWPAMCRFLKSCNSLRHLEFAGFRFSTCDFGASIPQSVQVIRLIYCTNLPDNTLLKLLKNCPNLEEVRMSDNFDKMGDEGSFNLPNVHYGLQKLFLASITLSDEILRLICSVCPNLELFTFADMCQVTKQGIEAMIKERCCRINSFEKIEIFPGFNKYSLYKV